MATDTQRDTARSLRIDTITGEVVAAFRGAGIPSIVVKGPGLARLLYDDGAPRPYGDSDVLVPHGRLAGAEAVLRRLGFEPRLGSEDVPSGVSFHHARPWGRRHDFVDLHWTLPGAEAPPGEVWRLVSAHARRERIGGAEAEGLDEAAAGLLTALHLASHGTRAAKAMADLERALERLTRPDWEDAYELASGIDALEAFGAGLRMCPPGACLADELGLPHARSVPLAIAAAGAPGTAHGIEALARAGGLRPRARLLARTLVPPRRYMPLWFPRAAGGRGWLALAYVYRPIWLAVRAWPSIAAWRSARRETHTLSRHDL